MAVPQQLTKQLKQWLPQSPAARRWLGGLGIIAVAGVISGTIVATGPTAQPQTVEEKAWPVSTVRAEPQSLAPSFTAYGRVEARNLANLSADLFAVIKTIHVREGDRVEAGTVLVELDDGELALDVKAREAELAQRRADVRSITSELAHLRETDAEHRSMLEVANAKLARHQQLRDDRLIADGLFDEVLRQTNEVKIAYRSHSQRLNDLPNRLTAAEASRDGAAAALARAQLIAAKTRLTAPFDGIVLGVPAAIGARAQPGTPLVRIADVSAYEVRVAVPPVYASQFASTQDTQAISASTTSGAQLRFSRLAGAVQSGQTSADALFSWQHQALPPAPVGSTVALRVALPPAAHVVAVPAQALYENQRVYVVEQERLRAVAVSRVGEHRSAAGEHQVLIRAPELIAGAEIITTQLPKATTGLKVATQQSAEMAAQIAEKASEIAKDKQEQMRKSAAQQVSPSQISLPGSGRSTRAPAAKSNMATDQGRVPSRRYRMS